MARTKKQTIDAATERKRQFQEEVHNQTHIDSSSSEYTNTKHDRIRLRPSKLSNVFKEESPRMSCPSKSTNECNILPQAVVRVTDICKSPAEMRNEDNVPMNIGSSLRNKESRDSSPRSKDSTSKFKDNCSPRHSKDAHPRSKEFSCSNSNDHREHTTKNIFEVMEVSPPKKRSPKKTSSPSPKSKDLEESLRALKSESERVRMEKSKKFNSEEPPKLSPKQQQGRRSPRHQSPNSTPQSRTSNNSDSPGERQKINIFTDDIGKELGKRIRSPRRLSEDMIALPIFSLRAKTGQSPKDGGGFSKYADEGNNVGFAEGASSSNNIFKSPSGYNSPCKKVSTQRNSEFTVTSSKHSNTYNTEDSKKNQKSIQSDISNNTLMSSICRDVVQEMTFSRSDLFINIDKHKIENRSDVKPEQDIEEPNPSESDCRVKEDDLIGEAGDALCVKISERSTEDKKVESQNSKDNTESDVAKAPLLCAMLVGDSHVVQDYSEKRERYNPEVTEISDSETEHSRAVSPNLASDQMQDIAESKEMNAEVDKSAVSVIECSDEVKNVLSNINNESDVTDDSQKQNAGMESSCQVNDDSRCGDVKLEQDTNTISERLDLLDCESKSEVNIPDIKPDLNELTKTENECNSAQDVTSGDSKNWQKMSIDLSSQLKKVNDDILKLIDIDVEDQFMKVPNAEEIVKETASEKETKLYKLISNLSTSLKENRDTSDICEIDKIVESCPKGNVHIVSSSFSDKKWESILSRLKHEKSEMKKSRHRLKREHMDADMENLVEKMSASTLQSSNEEGCANFGVEPQPVNQSTDRISQCEEDEQKEKKETLVSGVTSEQATEQSNCLMSTSSSSLNGSLCELDVDSMTNAATQAVNVPDLISDTVSEPGTSGLCHTVEIKISGEAGKSDQRLKRKFQKSKTCDDFSQESLPSSPQSKPGTLRRTNSSPQLLKSDSRSSSPCLGKDQVKSKLGGKIPIPGTSYSFKSTKKTVRKPRIIIDTKPLDVLMQFVSDDKGSKDIFFSQDLQKYLWIPSNRMIVTPAIRNEISMADKTAEEAWEKKLQLMLEEEERQRKKDEEVDKEYMKYEPGFDEVDGLLFMSFSSEAELLAHVRVEKALEWDKDDTMLRIARAKTFEETKAINGDMKGVKMKRLRGQHMRWKKYKRMYGNEIKVVLTAKEKNIPLEDIKILGKSSDASRIKGHKRKSTFNRQPILESKENELADVSIISHAEVPSIESSIYSTPECTNLQSPQEAENIDSEKKELSPKSRRQFNFSDRKAHKQLFKELNMDWEDRMIHRKLGGWSLKGNRPKEFSQAAKKREMKEIKAQGLDIASNKTHANRSLDAYTDSNGRRRKLVFPLISERMARSCLQTLELSDDLCQAARRSKRKKRFRANRSINTRSSFPPDTSPMVISLTSTPQSSVATAGSLEKVMDISTPEASVSFSESTINTTASPSLSLDLLEETVLEGVEIVSHASSPSVTESGANLNSPQVKSCSKPGCRYGCICHLLQSPISKVQSQDCSKEYCRLGCICDSLHSEQPVPTHQSHCGKPSCMLECFCSQNSGGAQAVGDSVEDNEDIPFLSSMKQRPRAGERFSNLPRREKTHRSAKNVDAITRKAMMLYETSEIYCEKVERATKKKSESLSSPPSSIVTCSPPSTSSFTSHTLSSANNTVTNVSHSQGEPPSVELSELPASMASSTVAFNAVNLVTSEVATVTASHFHSTRSQLFPWRPRKTYVNDVNIDIEVDEVRQTLPVVEPSAHKRKRKSHPLSDEIFSVSTCARTQPYTWSKNKHSRLTSVVENLESLGGKTDQSPAITSTPQILPSLPSEPPTHKKSSCSYDSQEIDLKISNVCSLVDEGQKDNTADQKGENATSHIDKNNAVVDLTILKSPSLGMCNESSVSCCSTSVPESRNITPGTLDSSVKRQRIHGRKISLIDMKAQQQNWHTSMVCLKARALPKTNGSGCIDGDEVQEEDEVKLLELAANCNWDGSKKEILSRVASCLTRGQYPQPRMLHVKDYVVEILPKAKQPSLIPQALRVKLPGRMYSIRVRITKRDDSLLHHKEDDCNAPVIDLSKPSPVKSDGQTGNSSENNSNVTRNLDDNFSSAASSSGLLISASSLSVSSTVKASLLTSSVTTPLTLSMSSLSPTPTQTFTDSSFHSSIGISGLNRICNTNTKTPVQQTVNQQLSKSAPGSRRSSIENSKDVKLSFSADDSQGADKVSPTVTVAKPLLDLNKIQILSRSSPIGVSTLNGLSNGSGSTTPSHASLIPNTKTTLVINSTKDNTLISSALPKSSTRATNSNTPSASNAISSTSSLKFTRKVGSTAATSLLNPDVILRKEKPSLKVPSFAVAAPGKSANSPTSGNELQYVQMVYEVDGQNEKKKTLIAVPISLTGANIDVKGQSALSSMPILTVPKPGTQSKNLPLNITPQNKGKLPQVIPGAPVIMKLPPLTSTSKPDSATTLKSVQIIPLSSMSPLLSKNTTTTKLSAVLSSVSIPSSVDSSLKNKQKDPVNSVTSLDKNSLRKDDSTCQEGTSVTQSRDRPISSSEISPTKDTHPKVIGGSCVQTNDSTDSIQMASGDDESKTISLSQQSLQDENKNVEETFLNAAESADSCAKASRTITVNQNSNEKSQDSQSSNTILLETVPLSAKSNKSGLHEENLISEQKISSVAVNSVQDPSTHSKSVEIECSVSIENRTISSTKESHTSDNHSQEPKELHKNNNQSGESVDSIYEVMDIEDLIVASTSDILTTSEIIDAPYRNKNELSSLDDENQPLQHNHYQSSSIGVAKKRKSPEPAEEVDFPLGSKKLRLLTEIPGILDEDSNLSSLVTASPQSYTSLQKGVFSSGMSSGSMEEAISISSDEEIDVGDDTSSFQNRVEKAWENDHSSMFSKVLPQRLNVKGLIKHRRRENQSHDSKHKVEYHNFLERNRRAKLKELFDNLGNTILAVQGVKKHGSKDARDADGNYIMPKATILTEAKSTIMYLNKKEKCGSDEIRRLMNLKKELSKQLNELKAQLLANHMPGRAIDAILNQVSRQSGNKISLLNEEGEEISTEIKTEIMDYDDYTPKVEPDPPTEQTTLSPATNVIVDTFCASPDLHLHDENPTVYEEEASDSICRTAPVEEYELEFYPL